MLHFGTTRRGVGSAHEIALLAGCYFLRCVVMASLNVSISPMLTISGSFFHSAIVLGK